MQTKKIFIALIFLAAAATPLATRAAADASITLLPQSGNFKPGQTFNVSIIVSPGSEKIDMVRAKLNFTAGILEIKNFSTSQAFGYQAGANGYDNSAGTFSWGAGAAGGVGSQTVFGTITFKALRQGQVQVSVDRNSLALSSGENVFNGVLNSASFSSVAAAIPTPAVKKAPAKSPVATPVTNQQIIETPLTTPIDSQIFVSDKPKTFTASLLGWWTFKMTFLFWAAGLIALVVVFLLLISRLQKKDKIKKI